MSIPVDASGRVVASPKTGEILATPEVQEQYGGGASSQQGASTISDIIDIANNIAMSFMPPQVRTVAPPPFTNIWSSGSQGQSAPAVYSPTPASSSAPLLQQQNQGGEQLLTSFSGTPMMVPVNRDGVEEGSEFQTLGIENDQSHAAGLDSWEREAAKRENREIRLENQFGEKYDDNNSDWGWIDNQLDLVGNNPVNDAYGRFFVEQGMSPDDVYAITHKPQSIPEEEELKSTRKVSPGIYDGTTEMLDDGSYDNYWKLTADSMTGTQYQKYRDELGMGGREYIDPTKVYSKRREYIENGFQPFTPDQRTLMQMVAENVLDVPARIGDAIGSAREYLTPDYQINFDDNGEQKSVSGKEFDKNAPAFMNSFYHDRQYSPDKFLSAPTDGSAYTTLINQFKVPDVNGNDTYHYGHLVDASGMPDGSVQLAFSDGSTVSTSEDYFKSIYDGQNVNVIPEVVPLQSAMGVVDVSNMGPNKYQGMINETVVPDESGEDTYHYGNLLSVDNGPNGTYSFTFEDGSTVNAPAEFFEGVYDPDTQNINVPFERVFLDDIKGDLDIKNEQEKPTLDNADVKYMPDMIMSDGSRLSLDDVERLYLDQSPDNDEERKDKDGKPILSDDDINYQFKGLFGLPFLDGILNNRPTRLGGQEIFKDDDLVPDDLSNVFNNAMDWTLGSIPISAGKYLPWVYSGSKASRALDSGIDPNSYDSTTDSYGLVAGGYDKNGDLKYGIFDEDENGDKVINDKKSKETRLSNAAGNLLVPLTEQIVGPIGEHVIPLEKVANKIPMKSAVGRFLRNELTGAAGESVEEVLDNIFEEGTQYGPDMFADPVKDKKTGDVITDQYGHEKRDQNTPLWKRMNNFLTDTAGNANAAAGGALVDVNMRLLPKPFGGAIGDFRTARKQDKARKMTGLPLYVDPNENIEDVKSSNKYAGLLNEDDLAVNGGN